MAVQRTSVSSRLQLQFQIGTDENNKPVVKNRYFNNMKDDAVDDNVHEVAMILSELQEYPLLLVRRIDTNGLDDI